ncbi:Tetratricopeptide TPR_2 repeat protein [Solidesulfovibrio fructosivorans JJ]]|uniref:Tetratricopeptide TPR_2 repeat protein n=1 Tax=Solidesulfovibrio fructosivorans JJ] TaxID=596151 RepID=E1JSV3_SOLFR|nr:tetratricopeptide repeat protein [Solidesulfovibrio fructosivorans]EFL52586.1 Tetratricopeptide TPR_2 repeat protein [Solidesulfovibrio fructosivorans JJ]]
MQHPTRLYRFASHVCRWTVAVPMALLLVCPCAWAQFPDAVFAGKTISDAEARLELARLLARNEATLDQAAAEYRRVLAASPTNFRIVLEYAEILISLHRYPDALTVLEPLAQMPNPLPEALAALGSVRLYSGDVRGAALAYERAYAAKPSLPGLGLKLAQTLNWSGRAKDALPLLERLHAAEPVNLEIVILLGRALNAAGKPEQAAELVIPLLKTHPDNVELLLAAADFQAVLGRAVLAKRLFERAETLDPSGRAGIAHAERSMAWGDFYRAEDGVRKEMAANGKTHELTLKLAAVLVAQQRYGEAANVYEALLTANGNDKDALTGLAQLRLLEKNDDAALAVTHRLAAVAPDSAAPLRLEAAARAASGNVTAALAAARKASASPDASNTDLRQLGDLLYKTGDKRQALDAYRRALALDPADAWSAWRVGEERDAAVPTSVAQKASLAAALKDDGRLEKAGRLFRVALRSEPDNYFARMGLAEVLAATGWYDDALVLLDGLAVDFPGDAKVLLTKARVLGWAKRYDASLTAYADLHSLKPDNPVPLREAARTAFWGKMPDRAALLYSALENGTYPAQVREAAGLEHTAKMDSFNNQFAKAITTNDALLAMEPGNQEALFDRAQAACALGMRDEEAATYQRMLTSDPMHTLAGQAVDRLRWRNAPSVRVGFSFWDEDGKGGRLAQITRFRWDTEFTVPVEDRYYLRAAQHLWLEDPKSPQAAQQGQSEAQSSSDASTLAAQALQQGQVQAAVSARRFEGAYWAEGQTLGAGGRVNQWLSGEFAFTNKQYSDVGLRPLYSGQARIELRPIDAVTLAFFYQRTDEITNDMSLAQGIQIDNWGGMLRLQPLRRIDLSFQGRYLNYSDDNQGTALRADAGVILTDHPHELKLAATGEYRDTREANKYVYQDDTLVTIVHPYWTPQDYSSGALTLGWRHDLAKDFFCGARRHYYGIQVSHGSDTTKNPFWRLEIEYLNDLTDRWTFSLKGLVQRSPQWDATGVWTGLTYRF